MQSKKHYQCDLYAWWMYSRRCFPAFLFWRKLHSDRRHWARMQRRSMRSNKYHKCDVWVGYVCANRSGRALLSWWVLHSVPSLLRHVRGRWLRTKFLHILRVWRRRLWPVLLLEFFLPRRELQPSLRSQSYVPWRALQSRKSPQSHMLGWPVQPKIFSKSILSWRWLRHNRLRRRGTLYDHGECWTFWAKIHSRHCDFKCPIGSTCDYLDGELFPKASRKHDGHEVRNHKNFHPAFEENVETRPSKSHILKL